MFADCLRECRNHKKIGFKVIDIQWRIVDSRRGLSSLMPKMKKKSLFCSLFNKLPVNYAHRSHVSTRAAKEVVVVFTLNYSWKDPMIKVQKVLL